MLNDQAAAIAMKRGRRGTMRGSQYKLLIEEKPFEL
jgi:hypothetical protein